MSPELRFKLVMIGVGTLFACLAYPKDTTRFTLDKVMDNSGTNHLALMYLIPKGWNANDKVSWDLSRRTAPVEFVLSASSPDNRISFSYLNELAFSFTRTPNVGNSGTLPPSQLTDFVLNVSKRNHPGVAVEIVDRQETPVASSFRNTAVMTGRAAKCLLKIRYVQGGVRMIMKAGFDFDGYESGTAWGRAHGFTNGDWYMSNVAQIIGPESEFTKAMKLAAVAFSSSQFDPVFVKKCQQVTGQIVGDMIGDGWARINANSENQQRALHDKWAANDKFTRDMCDYVKDQERYTDGKTQFIMPIGYNRALTNGTEFLMTNDPGSPGPEWTDLKKIN